MKKRIEKQMLPNGCSTSPITVVPANWNTKSASVKREWRITYQFFDPNFDKPKRVQVRGMNSFKDLAGRQAATWEIMKDEVKMLKDGFNPILGKITEIWHDEDDDYIIHPSTPWIIALKKAADRMTVVKSTASDLNIIIKAIGKAAERLKMSNTPISDIRIRHILRIFDYCKRTNKTFSDFRRNRYRTYLLSLFRELVLVQAVEYNPIKDIPVLRTAKRKPRQTLTKEEREKVDKHLKEKFRTFWLFTQIFYHSGSRISELLKVKTEDVNLKKQTFTITVLKGAQQTEVTKPIKNVAMPYWEEAMKKANKGQYIFSKRLIPGDTPIRPDQINKRWLRNVKKPLGITADFYSIKHSGNTDTVDNTVAMLMLEVQKIAEQTAASLNAHTTTDMLKKVYDVNNKARMDEIIRNLDNKFA